MISTAPSIAYTVATARCPSLLVLLRLLMIVSTATVEVNAFWAQRAFDGGAACAGEARGAWA